MTERDMQTGDGEVGICHVCGQRFELQEELAAHLMDAHEELERPAPEPNR